MTDCPTFVGFDQSVTFIVEDRSISVGFPIPVGAGEANTGANVGGGEGVFRDKTGAVLNFKSITGSGDATVTSSADEVNIDVSGVGGHAAWVQDEFTATAAQVSFILSGAPSEALSLTFNVNGIDYDDVVDYTISGSTVTWTNAAFVMEAGDKVIVRYY